MSQARLSILGLYNYIGDDLFKNLTLPTGIDKETLVNNILLRGADFEVLYPDADFLQFVIGTWSKKWQRTFEKWIEALSIEYNPLENYDRIEEWEDKNNSVVKRDNTTDNTGTQGFKIHDKTGTGNENINQVSAFDSADFQNDNKSIGKGSSESDTTNDRTDNLHEVIKGTDTTDGKLVHKGRLHGNIGVTTSQQMLQSELDIAAWNVYEKITDIFVAEFCIMIY